MSIHLFYVSFHHCRLSLFFFFSLPFCLFYHLPAFSPVRECSPTYQQDSPSTLNQINFLIFHSKASRPLLLMWINCINVQLILCHLLFTLRMMRANERRVVVVLRKAALKLNTLFISVANATYFSC